MFCSNCGKETANDASFCPNCGTSLQQAAAAETAPAKNNPISNQSKKKPKGCLTAIAIVVGVFVFLAVIGILFGDKSSPSTNDVKDAVKTITGSKSLELVDSKVIRENYTRYIVGTIKNNSDKEFSYAQVEINIYDKSGAQVGSTLANTNNLESNGIWKFKAPIIEDNAASYKIKDITGY